MADQRNQVPEQYSYPATTSQGDISFMTSRHHSTFSKIEDFITAYKALIATALNVTSQGAAFTGLYVKKLSMSLVRLAPFLPMTVACTNASAQDVNHCPPQGGVSYAYCRDPGGNGPDLCCPVGSQYYCADTAPLSCHPNPLFSCPSGKIFCSTDWNFD
jgi:hypothetical protein